MPLVLLIVVALAAGLAPLVPVVAAPEAISVASDSTRPLGTPVPGTIITRIDDKLRIAVETDAGIPFGTVVTVTWDLNGRILDAGRAEVISVNGRVATARIMEGEPNEGMQALLWVVNPEDHFLAGEATFKLPSPRVIIDRFIEAIGGEDRLRSHTSSRAISNISYQGQTHPVERLSAAPNKSLMKLVTPTGDTFMIGFDGRVRFEYDPASGRMKGMYGYCDREMDTPWNIWR